MMVHGVAVHNDLGEKWYRPLDLFAIKGCLKKKENMNI